MFQVLSFLSYWFNAIGAHSIQAPFAFSFYDKVLNSKSEPDLEVEAIRKRFLSSNQVIEFKKLGAQSKVGNTTQRVRDITRRGNSSRKISQLLKRIADFNDSKAIIDLGTSTGLNTAYLASVTNSKVISFEGNQDLCDLANSVFSELGRTNIQIIEGNIDDTLPGALQALDKIDLAFIDANHRLEPVIGYFELLKLKAHNETILVFDDIHWSSEMNKAWEKIKLDPDITLTIDLFKVGVVFFKKELDKENLIIQF